MRRVLPINLTLVVFICEFAGFFISNRGGHSTRLSSHSSISSLLQVGTLGRLDIVLELDSVTVALYGPVVNLCLCVPLCGVCRSVGLAHSGIE